MRTCCKELFNEYLQLFKNYLNRLLEFSKGILNAKHGLHSSITREFYSLKIFKTI